MRAAINGAELCVDTFGDPSDPAVLLIMGGAASMDRWEPPFCEHLAAAGRYVIRYDHRDTGGSTASPPGRPGRYVIRYDHRDTGGSTASPPGRPGYTGGDLTADALGVLDHLGVERAHLVGLSMGAGIAQDLALAHPERVRSLTLMSTTPIGPRRNGPAELPPMSEELRAAFAGEGQPPEPDWSDRAASIEYLLACERPYAGRRGLDDEAMRELLGRVYDRSPSMASATNHFLVEDDGAVPGRLADVDVPTLVVHGSDDGLFPLPHGEALAREIPGARLLVVDGMGHELPRWAWEQVLPAVIAVTATGG